MPTLEEKPKSSAPAYTTLEELKQYETMIDKTFAKKGDEVRKFVFKVIHIAPQFKGVVAEREKIDRFYVQKYEVLRAAGAVTLNAVNDPSDGEAAFFMDAKEFSAKFELAQV